MPRVPANSFLHPCFYRARRLKVWCRWITLRSLLLVVISFLPTGRELGTLSRALKERFSGNLKPYRIARFRRLDCVAAPWPGCSRRSTFVVCAKRAGQNTICNITPRRSDAVIGGIC